MANKSKDKGGNFERDICKALSLWYTYGEDDNIFWRTSGSGNRATVRTKKGQKTKYDYGDITFSNPDGSFADCCRRPVMPEGTINAPAKGGPV